ncbi:HECT-like ubiquitin-conjugating enzyme-binding-domain-containing protein [Scleroderma yunnanense]
MATLVRTVAEDFQQEHAIRSLRHVPEPFPIERLVSLGSSNDEELLHELATERVEYDVPEVISPPDTVVTLNDIQISVATVQQSCLKTLSDLLSVSTAASPSAQCSTHVHFSGTLPSSLTSANSTVGSWSGTSLLAALVHTLLTRDGISDSELSQAHSENIESQGIDEAMLLVQLHDLVDALAPSMHRHDAHLAQAIVALLEDLQQVPTSLAFTSPSSCPSPSTDHVSPSSKDGDPQAVLTTLQKKLSSLQSTTTNGLSSSQAGYLSPIQTVQSALLWSRIDEQLEAVVALCKARTSAESDLLDSDNLDPFSDAADVSRADTNVSRALSFDADHLLPPQYEFEYGVPHEDMPPAYPADLTFESSRRSLAHERKVPLQAEYPPEKVSAMPPTLKSASKGEMTTALDLDLVTHAIDRLYAVAPQLTNQRVELRGDKIAQMQNAQHRNNKGKSPAMASADDAELDKMFDLLGRANAREITDQRVTIDPTRKERVKGKLNLEQQRYTYIEHIVQRSSVGRLRSQDAEPSGRQSWGSFSLTVNPTSPLTDVGDSHQSQPDKNTSREGPEGSPLDKIAKPLGLSKSESLGLPTHKKSRSRSSSAPHIAWLRSASRDRSMSKSSSSSSSVKRLSGKFGSKSRPTSSGGVTVSGALNVVYVAEHHETLRHVLVFIALAPSSGTLGNTSTTSVGTLTAEVLPSTSSGTSGDWLLLRLSGTPSPPLTLPVSVVPGLKEVLGRNSHWEIKLSCAPQPNNSHINIVSESDDPPLLTAAQLTSLLPTSYICVSCHLPLVSMAPAQYRDLPSEYWEELVDAWMCHPEGQTLAKGRVQMHSEAETGGRGFGFWPAQGEALVGGSYILFESRAVVEGNVMEVVGSERGDNACLIRCICGGMIGRRHERKQEDGSAVRMYRLSKYAFRPISPSVECPKIPMSAFIVRDMLEHVRAHATYRFVLSDEEEEKPRLLVWLFKPKIRMSYMLASPLLLPKNDSLDASKVLYKILGPDSTTDIKELLDKYPGFPQAEHLFYPMDVCRKLAALLSESTRGYPESLRSMTGLDVGWLYRG